MFENTVRAKTFNVITPEAVKYDFKAEFLDEEYCQRYFFKSFSPMGAGCPHCNKHITNDITLKNFFSMKRCQCKSCSRWFTATTGTILQGSQLSVREFYLLCLFLGYGIDISEIARILKVHRDTVKLWQRKLKLCS